MPIKYLDPLTNKLTKTPTTVAPAGAPGENPALHYSTAYGGVPNLQTPQALQGQVSGIINQAIPGYSGLSKQAGDYIGQLMSGALPADVQDQIQRSAAQFGVSSGMPGSGLATARNLRDIGLTSLQQKQQGIGDLVSFLQGSSGTSALTPAQVAEQSNAQAQYAAAPDPMAAATQQIQTYKDLYNWQQTQQQAANQRAQALTPKPWWETANRDPITNEITGFHAN